MKLFKKLLCDHEFKFYKTSKAFEDSSSKLPYKVTDIFICKKCGKFKRIRI